MIINIILGLLLFLFLMCIYKIACLREEIQKLYRDATHLHTRINECEDDVDIYDSQLMSLRQEMNGLQEVKKPTKKKAYGKKSK